MPLKPRPFPPALPHGALTEPLPGLFFVQGTMQFSGVVSMRFSRNMTVVRQGERLVLVNTVRLDDAGLAALDALGKVTDIVRIAGNHGMDDPFYADRYKARVWAAKGQRYLAGFDPEAADEYFERTDELSPDGPSPIEGSKLFVLRSRPPEAVLLLPQHGGVLVTGDCLQNWAHTDEYFNLPARVGMPLLGFVKPCNVGPAWLKACKPPKEDLRGVLGLSFAHVLPAHGAPVLEDAREKYRPALERASAG